jgi:hypothetical protein
MRFRLAVARRVLPVMVVVWVLFGGAPARAGEIQIDAGSTVLASSWQGDFGAGGLLRLGYRFGRIVAIDFVGWEQMAVVNERLDTGLTFGVTGFIPLKRVRPSLRVFAIHQHEEGVVSVAQNPGGFLFGIGSGIRHRAGGGLTLGVEIPFRRSKAGDLEWVVLAEVEGIWFPPGTPVGPSGLGPELYYGGTVGIGFNYSLPRLP